MKMENKTIVLAKFADDGIPTADNFKIVTSTVESPKNDGDVLFQTLAMSADPYLRGGIKSDGGKKIGDPMLGFVAGKVVESKNPKWEKGDLFGGTLAFSTYNFVPAAYMSQAFLWKLNGIVEEKDISLGIGVLGMPGSTAYGGVTDILSPKEGETIWVSAAAGAVGSLVGQIAKQVFNCKVIGTCGGGEKCTMIKEKFGFDAAVDYKTAKTADELKTKVQEAAVALGADGIDMYFENVGGIHFEAAMALLKKGGRVAVCGTISSYNDAQRQKESFNLSSMIYKQQRIEGFVCMPWLSGKQGNFLKDMSQWHKDGKLQIEETNFDGIESWPEAFHSLFVGGNKGKVVVRV